MGKAARWFRGLLGGGKKEQGKDTRRRAAPPVPQPADRKRWSFGRLSRGSVDSAGNAAIATPTEAAWLKSMYGGENNREKSKHAIAVDVARLTSQGPAFAGLDQRGRAGAAVRIQTAFRGFLAKKALRALKALVKLQALVRGYLVRKQAAATLQSLQALVRAQAAVRTARCRGVPTLPPLNHQVHHPPVRPRFSLQQRYMDDARSEHRVAASSYGGGYDRSPKIVDMDTPRSRASSLRTYAPVLDAGDEWWAAQSASSLLLPPCHLPPPRVAAPSSRGFQDYVWCAPQKPRPATAQCTPRCALPLYAPATPTKSACGSGGALDCPKGYMSSTQSSEAKTRSQSAPKQRPETAGPRKRVPLREVVLMEARASLSGANMQRSCNRLQEAFDSDSRKAIVVGCFERPAAERERDMFSHRLAGCSPLQRNIDAQAI